MAAPKKPEQETYGAGSIKILEGLEAVRKRPGMYIGSTGRRGLHHLVWEVVDNAVDEAMAGFADQVDVRLLEDGGVEVRDNGRGIPVAMHDSGVPTVDVVMTVLHAGGKSTPDLLRRKQIHQDAPDAVILPGTEDEIAAILDYCSRHRIAVVPFGGGTSVVGGLDPIRGEFDSVVTLDLRRLDALHWLDEVSGEAELGAGMTGPQAEELLGQRGFSLRIVNPDGTSSTIGHSPLSQGSDPFFATFDAPTGILWLGSPTVIGFLPLEPSAVYKAWHHRTSIPPEIEGTLPPAIRLLLEPWYQPIPPADRE